MPERDSSHGGPASVPARIAWVLAAAATAAACNTDRLTPPPGFNLPTRSARIELAPGEFITFRGTDLTGTIEVPAAPTSRSFVLAVHNASASPRPAVPLRVRVSRVEGAVTTPSASRAEAPSARRAGPDPFDAWYGAREADFRDAVSRELRQRGARPSRPRSGAAPIRASRAPSAAAVGDTLEFGSPVEADGTLATCTSASRVTGVVRAVGDHFLIVEDTTVAGHLVPNDFQALLDEVESVAFPVDSAYFGLPFDLDANGGVVALITAEVNRLGAAGFFTRSDLAARADCPASNEGEVLWLVGPDPLRRHGPDPIPADLLRSRLPGVIAHELQHLVHAERRIFEAGGDFESVDELWLNEAMSHIAEEVSGLFRAGQRTGANLDYADLGTPEAFQRFDRYHLGVFRFLRDYLEAPDDVPAIVDGSVTRGELRRARGFGYLFLRWLADRYAAGGGPGLVGTVDEEAFFRSLTVGGGALLESTDNVVGTLAGVLGVARSWEDLFGEYVTAPAVDDAVTNVALAAPLRVTTWNLPAVFANARDHGFELDFPQGFPLVPRLLLLGTLPDVGFAQEAELLPANALYYRIEGVVETPLSRIRITSPDGQSLPAGTDIRVTVVRTL